VAEIKHRLVDRSCRTAPESGSAAVRNGCRKERTALTDVEPLSVLILRFRSRDRVRESFVSELIKPFCRRAPHMDRCCGTST